jgi:hypothetical protein
VHQITTTTNITIAIVKHPHDWQRIISARQYHMPVRHIARVMQSPWIAFYLPGWHATQPHRIRHVARITAMTIAPRRTYLPEEPTHPCADQLYAILAFDAIYTLRAPIYSTRWRRISIHHTTWGVLTRTYDLGALHQVARQLQNRTHSDDVDLFDLFAVNCGDEVGLTVIE